MKKRILPIRISEEAIEKADSLVPFVKERENPQATRSDVIRLCLDFGLDCMEAGRDEGHKPGKMFRS